MRIGPIFLPFLRILVYNIKFHPVLVKKKVCVDFLEENQKSIDKEIQMIIIYVKFLIVEQRQELFEMEKRFSWIEN